MPRAPWSSFESFIDSGFQKMLQKIGEDDELLQSLQDLLLSSSRDEKVEDESKLTKAYHNYKRKYVKHLSFNPKEENLSKVICIN